jgi:dTDP-4-amino-4,6-dideoxygalactose transaminase
MSRNVIMLKLDDMGISTRPGTHGVHMLGFYSKKYGLQPTDFPGAQASNDFSMAIPLHNRMTLEDFEYVVGSLKSL